ncbi:18095_t:CDS:2 [Acaulospora morrowiae]|uniref:18095_t:CDS:1 n=1 Tax=Acaulospora morrowiae TaxID=94023 RepID=A0A9N8VQK3_9GLOM|nr:18095_t:CDS:2 [Acaulospora morrowiae]
MINTTLTEIAKFGHFVSASCNDTSELIVLQNDNASAASDIYNDTSVQMYGLTSNSDALQKDTKSRIKESRKEASGPSSSLDSSSESYDESNVKQISELQSIPNTLNLSEQFSEQNTNIQKTKIPEIDIQPLIEELKIEPLAKTIHSSCNSEDEFLPVGISTNTSYLAMQKNISDYSGFNSDPSEDTERKKIMIWVQCFSDDDDLSSGKKTYKNSDYLITAY